MVKTVYFEIEDLIGNLIFTLQREGYTVTKLSYSMIEEYKDILAGHFLDNGIYPYFGLSRDQTYNFLIKNQDKYYEIDEHNIGLVKQFTIEELAEMYQGYLALAVLKVILDDRVIQETCEAYDKYINKEKVDYNKVKKYKLN